MGRIRKKALLYFMDEEVILYDDTFKKIAAFKGSFEEIRFSLESELGPITTLFFLVDRSHQDIQEEKLPPLFLWDRLRYFFHKKVSCSAQGGYAGFQFLKEGKELYFRWIHIPENDPLAAWIAWVRAYSGQIFFVTLEGWRLLKGNFSFPKKYQMLLYPLPSQTIRHVIFKGKRLLLSRLTQGDEGNKTSLHFLSRTYPDIHENIDFLSLMDNPKALKNFIASQKKPFLFLYPATFSANSWLRHMGIVLITILLLGIIVEVYQGFLFKRKIKNISSEISSLKSLAEDLKLTVPVKNVAALRNSLDHYEFLKQYTKSPLQNFDQIAVLLKNQPVHLESASWSHKERQEINLVFLMEGKDRRLLFTQFEAFLASIRKMFPKSQIQVLEAPFNSSPQETFENSEHALPKVQIKIIRS